MEFSHHINKLKNNKPCFTGISNLLLLIRWFGPGHSIHNSTYYNVIVFSLFKAVSWIVDYWLKEKAEQGFILRFIK